MTSLLNMSSLAVACATTVTNYLDLCEDGDRPTLDPATCAPSSVPAGRTAFWMAASAKASRRDRSSVGIGCCSSNVQRIFGPPSSLHCREAKPLRARLGRTTAGCGFLDHSPTYIHQKPINRDLDIRNWENRSESWVSHFNTSDLCNSPRVLLLAFQVLPGGSRHPSG